MFDIFNQVTSYLSSSDYVVTVIEDEEQVALAAKLPGSASSTPLFTATIITMVIIALLVGMTIYFIQCRQLQIRIGSLLTQAKTRKGHYNSWNYRSLKEECARLEFLASDKMFEDALK